MALSHSRPTVSATASAIVGDSNDRSGQSIVIQNPSAGATVYLGGSGVTSSTYGYALAGGSDLSIDLSPGESLYAITASGTQQVNILRQGVQYGYLHSWKFRIASSSRQ